MSTAANLAGLRVLLVEDQMIVAMEMEHILLGLGCVVVGPVGRLDQALRLAQEAALDGAVLDVSLDGDKVFPVAEQLLMRGIPFAFATGYGASVLPEKWRDRPRLSKPFRGEELEQIVRRFSAAGAAGGD